MASNGDGTSSSSQDVAEERRQEEALKKKYGSLPSKKALLNKKLKGQGGVNGGRTYFDSADHFTGNETGKNVASAAQLNKNKIKLANVAEADAESGAKK